MVPSHVGMIDESGIRKDPSDISNIVNAMARQTNFPNVSGATKNLSNKGNMVHMVSRQANFPNSSEARQINGTMNWDDKSKTHSDTIVNKKYLQKSFLPESSSSSAADQVKEGLVATGLQLPKNGILNEKLQTVSQDLEDLMEKQSIHLPEVQQVLKIRHLKKDVQSKVRRIEQQYRSSFSTDNRRTGTRKH